MATPRRSLRDRNSAAIAHDVDAPTETPTPTPSPQLPGQKALDASDYTARQHAELDNENALKRLEQEKAATAAPRSPKTPAAAPAGDTDRLGIYLTPTEFDDARGAYLADWTNGGEADTFARWIAAAMDTHAARTPQERAARDRLRGRSAERTGSTRSFTIPTVTVQRMRAAITADQQAGRWPSDSAWCAEAITLATEDARAANGGTLPTPPARLPNRLVR